MGAWGTGPFDNDDALDYVMDVADAPDGREEGGKVLLVVGCVKQAMTFKTGKCDAAVASNVLVAAEIIAALHGNAHPELKAIDDDDDDSPLAALAAWIRDPQEKDRMFYNDRILELARTAVERVRDNSELAELWADAQPKHAEEWRESADDLLNRLRG
jgi:hypothetical protein